MLGGKISGNTASNGDDVYPDDSGDGLLDGNDDSSHGNNNNGSLDDNDSGVSNGNNGTSIIAGFSLRDIVITCVITIAVALYIVIVVLRISFQKKITQVEKIKVNLFFFKKSASLKNLSNVWVLLQISL
jgi:hypothetical protein